MKHGKKKTKNNIRKSKKLDNGNREKDKKCCDKKERRDTRQGTIISIIAILGTICTVLFKYTKSVLSVWPISGWIYYVFMWSLFIVPLSAALLIFKDIIIYVIYDLKRYNVQDSEYEQYDKESDKKYYLLITNFRIVIVICVTFFMYFIVLLSIEKYLSQKLLSIVILTSIMAAIVYILNWIKRKKIEKENVLKVVKTLGAIVLTTVLVLYCAFFLSINRNAQADVQFASNGTISISNAIDEQFGEIKITVYDSNNTIFLEKDVQVDDVLGAKEAKIHNISDESGEEIGYGQGIKDEMLYWFYQYDLKDLSLSKGKYCVEIEILQDGKSVELINMFSVEKKEYLFAKSAISKKY